MAEAVTLAHVTRPLVLARALPADGYEIHFACSQKYEGFLRDTTFTQWPLHSISPDQFLESLAKGEPLYDRPTLESYVEEDVRLMNAVMPDMVVGDFRLSLAVSAAHCKVPYVSIVNAHWSPYASLRRFPLPEIPLAGVLGVPIARTLFHILQPLIFALHARPLNLVRRSYGLPPLGDLRHVYTHGDFTLCTDIPKLVPTANLPPNHHYIGPVIWSPEIELPAWWANLPQDRPCVYVTLGSSGQVSLLPDVISALSGLPIIVLVATAGRLNLNSIPSNVMVADYLPGAEAARRSALVVCSGGSATAYQALAEGVPVLGLASNMDQHLTMSAIERCGAGILMRAGLAKEHSIRRNAERLLGNEGSRAAARSLAQGFADYDAPTKFCTFLEKQMGVLMP